MVLQPARELNFSGAKFSHIEGWDIAAEHTVYYLVEVCVSLALDFDRPAAKLPCRTDWQM